MRELRYTLVSDGSSDRALMPILTWLLREHLGADWAIQPAWADLSRLPRRPKGLAERVSAALDLFPCELLFIHRDAERDPVAKRAEEIESACTQQTDPVPFVGVVTVRMQEAWLLFDAAAIRSAAGNPNGRNLLSLPPLKSIEGLPDPKKTLHELLREASGLKGRRRASFLAHTSAQRVAEFINDFSQLRELSAFNHMEAELERVLKEQAWIA